MSEPLEFWGTVEIMGHQRVAGRIIEQEIAGAKFVRVDVPESETQQASTQFLGAGSIYRIRPMTEELTRQICTRLDTAPISVWDAQRFVELQGKLPAPSHPRDSSFEADPEED